MTQEIYAGLIMYNFSELIPSHVVIQKFKRKRPCKANFSVAVQVCRQFLLGNVSPPDVESTRGLFNPLICYTYFTERVHPLRYALFLYGVTFENNAAILVALSTATTPLFFNCALYMDTAMRTLGQAFTAIQ